MNTSKQNGSMFEKILDYVYGELPPDEAETVRARIESDPEWKDEYELISGTSRVLDSWDEQPVPAGVTQGVLRRIEGAAPGRSAASAWLRMAWERLAPVAAAVFVSVAFLWVTTSSLDLSAASMRDLLFCGVLWGGVYHMVFLVLMRREPSQVWVPAGSGGFVRVELRRAVLWAVVAFVLFMGVAQVTPNPGAFETRAVYLEIAKKIPYFVSFLLPAFYALAGCLVAAFFLGRKVKTDAGTQGTLMGVLAGILIALDLYTYHITYAPFGLSTLLHLAVWTASGVAVAVASGYAGAILGSKTV
jgi:hypothetical protein